GTYRGNLANAKDWHVYFFGGYELKELALMTDLLRAMSGAVALDIGGNQGGHTLTMAKVAAVVHSVEPYGPLADRIVQLVEANGVSNVKIHRVGLGDKPGMFDYFLDPESSNQGTGSFLEHHNDGGVAARLEIVRGDEYFNGILPGLDFIKIDIEGFEAPALSGMGEILDRDSPIILMEVTHSSAELFREYGGLQATLPFPFRLFEVANPTYRLGVFQRCQYRLVEIAELRPRKASHNVLIVPESRMAALMASRAATGLELTRQ
ncbi:MAG: FkbM family methyltransferase, partial [Novosphingobium sp.]|nr:FkbM family methyltransferase [Novosphingobium sp.]